MVDHFRHPFWNHKLQQSNGSQRKSRLFVFTIFATAALIASMGIQPALAAPGDYAVVGGGVTKVSRLSGASTLIESQLGNPIMVEVDSNGNYIVSDGRDLLSVTPAGEIDEITSFQSLGITDLGSVIGLTIDSAGNYILAVGSNLVSLNTDLEWSIIASGLGRVADVEIDSAGNYIVVDDAGPPGRILSVSPAGVVTFVTNIGIDPFAIAIDSADNYYVTDFDGRIRKVSLGTVSVFSSADQARGIAIDLDGDIIAATRDGMVLSIDPVSSAVYTVSSGLGRLIHVAVDPLGNYIIANGGGNLLSITPTGEPSVIASVDVSLTAVDVDSGGNYIVSEYDGAESKIESITPSGIVSTIVDFTEGLPPEILPIAAVDIAADLSGNIIVADGNSPSLFSVMSDGTVTSIASLAAPATAIAVDSDGNYVVAIYDGVTSLLELVTPGGIVTTIADLNEESIVPIDIAIAPNGNTVVIDQNSPRFYSVSQDGNISTRETLDGIPIAIAVDSNGDYILSIHDEAESKLALLTQNGLRLGTLADFAIGLPEGTLPIVAIDIVIDSNGNVILADGNNPALFSVVLSDKVVIASGLGDTMRIAIDDDGKYIISNEGGSVVSMDSTGDVTTIAHTLGAAYSVAIDHSGNYVAGDAGNGRLYHITASGDVSLVRTGVSPVDIAVESDGNYIIAEKNQRKIVRVTPSGDLTVVKNDFGTDLPIALTIDSDGNYIVLFSDQGLSHYGILSITPQGDTTTIRPLGPGINSATGIELNGCGEYVLSTRSMGIVSVSPEGAVNVISEDVDGFDIAIEPSTHDTSTDTDSDGIPDCLDTDGGTASGGFADNDLAPRTTGVILDRGDQILTVTDSPDPDGVVIASDGSSGAAPAQVEVCDASGSFSLSAGDEILVTCDSVELQVVSGSVDVTFRAQDGSVATTTLNTGQGIKFSPDTVSITNTGSGPVQVVINGETLTIGPGESVLDSDFDGYLDPIDNCLDVFNPDQLDSDNDGAGDACDVAEELFCGKPISSYNAKDGTSGKDNLIGGSGDDLIRGFGGNDVIKGNGGDDCLIGGPGVDVMQGGAGNDGLYGEEGVDALDGGAGHDILDGGDGWDAILGGAGNDMISGGLGNDAMEGSDGNDQIDGGAGTDVADGGKGTDACTVEKKIRCES